MCRAYYDAVQAIHERIADEFIGNADGRQRHVECHVGAGGIYVYLYEDGVHVQTQVLDVPDHWFARWPTDRTLRRYVHRNARIGCARITSISS